MVKTSQEESQAKGREAPKASAPSAEKAPHGVNICVPKCQSPFTHAGGTRAYLSSAWLGYQCQRSLGRARYPTLACFSNPPRATHSQGEAQTVRIKLNHCNPNPKPWHSPLGMVPFGLGNLDRQTGKYKPSAKVYPATGRSSKTSLILARKATSTQLFFVCLTCSERVNVFASTWNPVTVILDV